MPVAGALLHAHTDLVAAVLEFDRDEPASDGDSGAFFAGLLLLVGEDDAGALGTGVDAQLHSVDFRVGECAWAGLLCLVLFALL